MVALFCAGALAAAGQTTAPAPWLAEIQHRHQELIARNGPGTNPKLRDELLKMRDEDQAARGLGPGVAHKDHIEVAANLAEVDAALTAQLKTIIQNNGWPTIAVVGIDASNAAMLILTHTRDHAWQASLLPALAAYADHKQIDGAPLAMVIDKELVAEGKLQRYGSQFKLVDGEMAMFGVEDPAGLDKRRAQVMLPPMEVYEQQLAQMYHLKVSRKIVSAAK
jgi:hypothetical protein